MVYSSHFTPPWVTFFLSQFGPENDPGIRLTRRREWCFLGADMNTTFTKQLKTIAPVTGLQARWQHMSICFGSVGMKS